MIKFALGILPFLTATHAFGASVVFSDFTAFSDATADLQMIEEDFTQEILAADQITLSTGIVSTNSGGTRSAVFIDNRVRLGEYNNTVDSTGLQGSTLITLTFPEAVTALGVTHLRVNPNLLQISFFEGSDTETYLVRETGRLGSFFGFVSDDPFQEIQFTTAGPADNFDIVGLSYGSAALPPSPVPLGSSGLLLISALAVFRLARRDATPG